MGRAAVVGSPIRSFDAAKALCRITPSFPSSCILSVSDYAAFVRQDDDARLAVRRAESERQKLRRRDEAFSPFPLDHGAWNILLFAFVAQGSRFSVGDACAHSGLPRTTALRRISELEAAGLMSRQTNEFDRRVDWLALTPLALDLLTMYFGAD